MKQSPIILGIDPGYDRLGWSVGFNNTNKLELINLGCIQTNKKDNIFSRYQQIQRELQAIITKYQPQELAIETLFFSSNKKTALRVSESRGVVIAVCLDHGLIVHEYSPNEIKLTVTGYGSANKQAVEKMVKMQITTKFNKQLDDAIDAVAVAMTHCFSKR